MKSRFLLLIFGVLIIGGCATITNNKAQKLDEEWKGKNFNDLIAAKGPPGEKMDDNQGGKIFIYSSSELSPDSGSSGGSSHGGGYGGGGMGRHSGGGSSRGGGYGGASSRGETVSHISYEMFWINSDGFIYRTAYQRTGP
jgi:hypothetical protein